MEESSSLQPKDQALKTVARGASIFFFGIMVGRLLGYFIRIVVARTLGVANYGLISLGISVLEIAATIGLLGLPTAINRFVPFYLAQKKPDAARGTIRSALKIVLPMSGIIATIILLFNTDIAVNVYKKPALIPVLQYLALGIPFYALMMFNSSIFTGLKRMDLIVYTQQLLRYIAILSIFIILYLNGFGLKAALFAYPIGYFLTAVIGLIIAQKLFPFFGKSLLAKPNYREIIDYSWPLILVSMIWFIMDRVATLMLGYFKSAEIVGIYNVGMPLAQFLPAILQSFTTIFMPIASTLISTKNFQELKKAYSTTSKWILLLTLPLFFALVYYARELIIILFGKEFVAGAPVLQILSVGFLFHAIVGPTTTTLNAFKKTKITLVNTAVCFAVNIALHLILIPRYGSVGAAIASAAALILINLLAVIELQVMYRITPFSRSYWISLASATLPFLFLLFMVTFFAINMTIIKFLGFSIAYIVLYLALLYGFKAMEEEDLAIVHEFQKKIGANLKPLERIFSKFKK